MGDASSPRAFRVKVKKRDAPHYFWDIDTNERTVNALLNWVATADLDNTCEGLIKVNGKTFRVGISVRRKSPIAEHEQEQG